MKQRKPKSAGESIQVVETVVAEALPLISLKRRFFEIEQDLIIPEIKMERSLSSGSDSSGTTGTNIELDVDEETLMAASILGTLKQRLLYSEPPRTVKRRLLSLEPSSNERTPLVEGRYISW
jgi:hypothetical protein